MQTVLDEAISQGDVEKLVLVWKSSLIDTKGDFIRKSITDQLPYLSKLLALPQVKTFRELIQNYDVQQLEKKLRNLDLPDTVQVIVGLENIFLLHHTVDNIQRLVLAKINPRSGVDFDRARTMYDALTTIVDIECE